MRRHVLLYHIGNELYRIEVKETSELTEPSGEALAFIARIRRGDGTGAPPVPDTPPVIATQQTQAAQGSATTVYRNPTQKLSSEGTTRAEQTTKEQSAEQTPKTTQPKGTSGKAIAPPDWQIKPVVIETGTMPEVKFVATDPCAAGDDKSGLPWQKGKPAEKMELPKGVEAASPPIIPDLKSLSQVTYNAAVSSTFEAKRLLYGPMSDDDTRKYEAT